MGVCLSIIGLGQLSSSPSGFARHLKSHPMPFAGDASISHASVGQFVYTIISYTLINARCCNTSDFMNAMKRYSAANGKAHPNPLSRNMVRDELSKVFYRHKQLFWNRVDSAALPKEFLDDLHNSLGNLGLQCDGIVLDTFAPQMPCWVAALDHLNANGCMDNNRDTPGFFHVLRRQVPLSVLVADALSDENAFMVEKYSRNRKHGRAAPMSSQQLLKSNHPVSTMSKSNTSFITVPKPVMVKSEGQKMQRMLQSGSLLVHDAQGNRTIRVPPEILEAQSPTNAIRNMG